MGKNIEIAIAQKSISTDRLLKIANKYRRDSLSNPLFLPEDHFHIINFMGFLEKELAGTYRSRSKKKSKSKRKIHRPAK